MQGKWGDFIFLLPFFDLQNREEFGSKPSPGAFGMQHLYKNLLQNYAQKRNFSLPEYSCEFEGPPHASRFKSNVTINGITYESPEFFSTIKETEHAVAKVAWESLSTNEIQEVSL
ncbi:HLA class II histocompatibility antigen, DR beta 4 chain [Sarracenia purpurea var. burkii]